MRNPLKVLGAVLVAIAVIIPFFEGTPWMTALLLGAFGIALFFWG